MGNSLLVFFMLVLFRLNIAATNIQLSCGEVASGTAGQGAMPLDIHFTAGSDPITFSTCNSDASRDAYLYYSGTCNPAQGKTPSGCSACGGHETWTRNFPAGSRTIQFYWFGGSGSDYYQIDMICATTTTTTTTTDSPSSAPPTSASPTTTQPTTNNPTTAIPTTNNPTTNNPTINNPTTFAPTTINPTTSVPTTHIPTSSVPTTSIPTSSIPTTNTPTTNTPTRIPTTSNPSTNIPTTMPVTTSTSSSSTTHVHTTSSTFRNPSLHINVPTVTPINGNGNEVFESTSYGASDASDGAGNLTRSEDKNNLWFLFVAIACGVGIIVVFVVVYLKKKRKLKQQKNRDNNNNKNIATDTMQTPVKGTRDGPYGFVLHSSPQSIISIHSASSSMNKTTFGTRTLSEIQLTDLTNVQSHSTFENESDHDDVDGLYMTGAVHQTAGYDGEVNDVTAGNNDGEGDDGLYTIPTVQTAGNYVTNGAGLNVTGDKNESDDDIIYSKPNNNAKTKGN